MVRTRSVGTRIRPTCVSRPSILTFRANFSRTWSSLLLATRRTKNCMCFGARGESGERGLVQNFDHPEKPREKQIDEKEKNRHDEHERDDHLGRADDFLSAGPVHLLHFTFGGDEKVHHFRLIKGLPL